MLGMEMPESGDAACAEAEIEMEATRAQRSIGRMRRVWTVM
jgi:hypothetical protein